MMRTQEIAVQLKNGGVGVLPTDTLYGLVGQAVNQASVERIYRLKQRQPDKPFIILIADYSDVETFQIKLGDTLKRRLDRYWPGPTSIILPCPGDKLAYLHRGTHSLAFRWPAKKPLQEALKLTGPLVAPSANPEGQIPAKTVQEAKDYFGEEVDFYADGGTLASRASKLIRFDGDNEVVLRP